MLIGNPFSYVFQLVSQPMDIRRFREIVAQAIDGLPEEFGRALDNIEIVVEDWPSSEQLRHFGQREGLGESGGHFLLLGLYQGVPKGRRQTLFYSGVLPDKITLFRKSIERFCGGDEKRMTLQIKRTLLHEIGHYFGIDDRRLRSLGY